MERIGSRLTEQGAVLTIRRFRFTLLSLSRYRTYKEDLNPCGRLLDGPTTYQRRALGSVAALLGALALALLVVAGCGGGDDADASDGGGTVSLVAYSTPREAYEARSHVPGERRRRRRPEESYAASGEQRRAIEEGLPADLVHLSLEPDVTSLADAGMVDADWNQNEYDGMLTNSVVVFAVRPGTPRASRPGTTCSATASR